MAIELPIEIDPHKKVCDLYQKNVLPKLLKHIDKNGGSILAQVNSHTLNDISIAGGSISLEGDLNWQGVGKVYTLTKAENVKSDSPGYTLIVDSDQMGPNIGHTILQAIEAKEWNESHPNGPKRPVERTKLNDGTTEVDTITIVTEKDLMDLMKRKFFGQNVVVSKSLDLPSDPPESPAPQPTSPSKKPVVATA